MTVDLRAALQTAVETLAAGRHLIGKYTPDHHWLGEHDKRISELKTILAALPPPPAGDWVLVPRAPTDGMIEAGFNAMADHNYDTDLSGVWAAMLSAAPPAGQEG